MKKLISLGLTLCCFAINGTAKSFNPIAKAGPDQTIYLTKTSVATLDGSASSADSYQWTKIYDVAQKGASIPVDNSTIVSPTSAVTSLTGLIQGVWYYQLAATSGGVTALDTVVIKVDYDGPPANSTLLQDFNWTQLASTANDRHDTTGYLGYGVGNYYGPDGYIIFFERSRLNGMMIDSSRGKFYSTLEDGYGWNNYEYGRCELNYGNFSIDSNKTYVFEWKGYYPQSITSNIPLKEPLNPSNYSRVVSPMQIHGNDSKSPPFSFIIYHDSLCFTESGGQGNGASGIFKVMPTDDSYILNNTHTIRMTIREGKGYLGQDAFIKIEVDGVQKYYRDSGQVGQTFQQDYIKFASLYDWNQAVTDVDSLARGKKFSLVTEAFRIYLLPDNKPPTATAGSAQTITLPVNSVKLSGSGSDVDGTIKSYQWTKTSGPSSYNINTVNSATTTVSGLVQGVYQFSLTITDNDGGVGTSVVQITVNAANIPPVATAGNNTNITLPTNSTILNGNGTDADGTIKSYLWTKISGPSAGTIGSANSASTPVAGLVQGVYQFELKVTDNQGGVGKDTVSVTVDAAPNIPPTAAAGTNQTITLPANSVSLTGSGSDADGTIASYQWTKISGPSTYNIASPNSATTNASGLIQGLYVFQLTVTDNDGAIGTATVQTTVNAAPNIPPTAAAGTNQTITLPANSVNLTGSGSDADGTIASYQWTKISGPSAYNIVSPNSASTNISGLTQGVYQFQLTVTDNAGAIGTATVQITVNAAPNIPPTAAAGTNQTITLPANSVILSGNGSDADGTIASYQWAMISGHTTYNIVNTSSSVTNVTGLTQGVYTFQLTVTDNNGAIGTATVQITVNAAANIPPSANAGTNQTITLPANSVSLSGSGNDADGTITSYLWTKISGPSSYNVVNPGSASTNVSGLVQGVYQFQLTVTDNGGAIGTGIVWVTVNPAADIPPIANAGSDVSISLPTNSVSLTGSGSDADGTITSYQWTKISGPSSYSITSPGSASTNVSGLVQGLYQFQLTVTDDKGEIGTATVQVAVNATPNIPPTANAGSNQTITLPSNSVSLSGSGSDADGTISSYQWSKISGPSSYNIVNPSLPITDVSGLVQGVYQFQLSVIDNNRAIGSSIIKVIVNAAANIPPTANAGSNKSINLPINSVSLTGSGGDADGTIASYQWIKISGPSAYNIVSPNSSSTNITGLVQGLYQFQLTVTDNAGAIGTATVQVQVNAAANLPPTANAGSNQTITLPTNIASLSGSGIDADGTIASYKWTKVSGPSVFNIVNPSSSSTDVSTLVQGVYSFQLTVTDNDGAIGTSTILVTVNAASNIPPTANAGSNKSITLPVSSVSLAGSGNDADGTIVSYQWSKISGPAVFNIVNSSSPVTDVSGLVQGVYYFQLTVTDNDGAIGTAKVQITVNAAVNQPPISNAGTNQAITLPVNSVSLSGSGNDADGTIASYQWTKISGPSNYNIVSPKSASTNVTGLIQGVYAFQLKVTDNDGAIGTATVQITVNAAVNQLPISNAGTNQTITLPVNSVSLSGSGSDADGTISSYLWTKISGPSTFNIVNPSSPVTDVSGLVEGVYKFQLTVTDNKGNVSTGTVQVTVNSGIATTVSNTNIAPKANAGNDTTILAPSDSVTLNGSGTDLDGSIVGYLWKQISGPSSATFSSNNTATTDVSKLVEGTYEFELTVMDDKGLSGKDTVNVTVALGRLAPDPNYVKIYPNPVSDLATIEINTGKVNADLVILVTDMSGKSIFRKEIVTSTSVTKEQINMGTFVKGTYVITVLIDGQDQQSFKVVKL